MTGKMQTADILEETGFFQKLNESTLKELASGACVCTYERGEVLYRAKEEVRAHLFSTVRKIHAV